MYLVCILTSSFVWLSKLTQLDLVADLQRLYLQPKQEVLVSELSFKIKILSVQFTLRFLWIFLCGSQGFYSNNNNYDSNFPFQQQNKGVITPKWRVQLVVCKVRGDLPHHYSDGVLIQQLGHWNSDQQEPTSCNSRSSQLHFCLLLVPMRMYENVPTMKC